LLESAEIVFFLSAMLCSGVCRDADSKTAALMSRRCLN